METGEKRIALVHRVLVPDEHYPIEYAILVTDRRSIFIRQKKTRSSFVLRGEMRYGTALVTDTVPKTLEDFATTSLDSLESNPDNLSVSHKSVQSLVLRKEVPKFRLRDVFVWLTMRRQGEIYQVYHFEMTYLHEGDLPKSVRFYMVPLGAYFKPRRVTQTRETILREYAFQCLKQFEEIMPAGVVSS